MILVINGSPNTKSQSMSVTKSIIKDKKNVKIINAYDKTITSCDDCKYCEKKIGCSKKDDMQYIYDLLKQTDTLIISSPIYFGALSDKLLTIINRFQRYYGQKFDLKEGNIPQIKNIITITSQGSTKNSMFKGTRLTHNILIKLFQPDYNKILQAKNCDIESPLNNKRITSIINKISKII